MTESIIRPKLLTSNAIQGLYQRLAIIFVNDAQFTVTIYEGRKYACSAWIAYDETGKNAYLKHIRKKLSRKIASDRLWFKITVFDIKGKLFRVLRFNVTFCKLRISPPAVIFTAGNLQLYPYSPPRNTQTEAFAGLVITGDQTFDRYVPVIYGIHIPKHRAWFRDNLTLALQSRWELLFGNLVKAILCLW